MFPVFFLQRIGTAIAAPPWVLLILFLSLPTLAVRSAQDDSFWSDRFFDPTFPDESALLVQAPNGSLIAAGTRQLRILQTNGWIRFGGNAGVSVTGLEVAGADVVERKTATEAY